uniref:Reverse transcriptase zinc-binding domain-containing protein n=1 Tax=Brassica oleracea var. oleracea TaxID=109376 RepID=A0A0D3D2U7_BRAOL
MFCGEPDETREYLYFACPYTYTLWVQVVGNLFGVEPDPDWEITVSSLLTQKYDRITFILLRLYHMEFLEIFGCVWSSKEVIKVVIGRAIKPGATSSERHSQVARHSIWERRLRSDTARSLAKKRPGSDLSQRRAEEELCFINNNGSWYKKEPNFQYNNYQQKSYPNNQQSGYPPRNNHQCSYQPQQNPSSGSSAPQESRNDTLLKQILESQTRSEKHVHYELKNLHSKIYGSYNELNNKFSHLASTVKNLENQFASMNTHQNRQQ